MDVCCIKSPAGEKEDASSCEVHVAGKPLDLWPLQIVSHRREKINGKICRKRALPMKLSAKVFIAKYLSYKPNDV